MTRKIYRCVAAGLLAAALQAILLAQAGRVPLAAYESDYFRADKPAYHLTPVKYLAGALVGKGDSTPHEGRKDVAFLRVMGLLAFIQFVRLNFGNRRAFWAFAIFLSFPPTLPYLVRLDSWMDSVSLLLIALYGMSRARQIGIGWTHVLWSFFAGMFAALALDSKVTAALTLAGALIVLFHKLPVRRILIFAGGATFGFGLAQIGWILNPLQALDHVRYWQSINAAKEALPVFYPVTELFRSIPLTIWCLTAIGALEFKKDRTLAAFAGLSLVPVVFFMSYRKYNPDGMRHLFLALPFFAIWAAAGIERLGRTPKIIDRKSVV